MAIQTSQNEPETGLDQFSQAQFNPVQFLNDTLPPLNLASQTPTVKQNRTSMLQSSSTEIQTLLSKLNTHSIRSSSELTTSTDEILRGGNRLAYEVEVLRGDVNSLYELLTDSLRDDISRFVIEEAGQDGRAASKSSAVDNAARSTDSTAVNASEPDFIQQLRTLGTIKSRLEAVIHVFGEALQWPVAPSEVSMASSLISVSAPELGVVNSPEDDRAREYTRKLRNEITEILDSEGGGHAGLAAATKKIDGLRSLSQVWRGTAEERARTKVVDGWAKLVEDRRRTLDARAAPTRSNTESSPARTSSMPGRAGRIVEGSNNAAAGLFRNLQKLRDEIYQD